MNKIDKSLVIFITLFELITLSLLFKFLYNTSSLNEELYISTEQRLEMIEVADKLRQSSDDLTHFARTYVVTGDKEFKLRYFKTLDIRNGKVPRPKLYDAIYWDLNKQSRIKKHPDGKKISLKDIFKLLPFSNQELMLLKQSENNSNDLVNLEVRAFESMEKGNQQLAIKLMHSMDYYKAKDKIMNPIDDFIILLNKRTKAKVFKIKNEIDTNFKLLLLISLIFIIGNIRIFRFLRKIEKNRLVNIQRLNDELNEQNHIAQQLNRELEESEYELQLLNESLEQKVEKRTYELNQSNKKIKDSIQFASLIQKAILPQEQVLYKYTKEHFTIWQPRDIVGGDIYFTVDLKDTNELVIMVIDGAGHGVSGAFVTMLVKAIENQITSSLKIKTLDPSPAKILEYFNYAIKTMLKQEKGSKSNAGFDGGILYFNKTTKECSFAGAKTDLYIINDNKLDIVKGDRKNVGFVRTKIDQHYTNHTIELKENTKLYIATDGIYDQEGESKTRYGIDRFKDIIINISNKSFEEQKDIIMKDFTNFKKDIEQTDDVTIVGLNF